MSISTNNIKNYFTAQLYINDKPAVDFDGEELITPAIDSIHSDQYEYTELFDHAFYLKNAEEFMNYDNHYWFCDLVGSMIIDFFAEDYRLSENEKETVILSFYNGESRDLMFVVFIEINEVDIDITVIDNDVLEDDDCDGDCEHCCHLDEEDTDIKNDVHNSDVEYFFGFSFDR